MAKQKIIVELADKIDKCNWDLKAAYKEIEVKENEKKELQENLNKVLSICVSACDWSTYVSMYVLPRIISLLSYSGLFTQGATFADVFNIS